MVEREKLELPGRGFPSWSLGTREKRLNIETVTPFPAGLGKHWNESFRELVIMVEGCPR